MFFALTIVGKYYNIIIGVVIMICLYKDLIKKYGSDYQIKKLIADGKIKKWPDGLYSDNEEVSLIDLISIKYPHAVIAELSALGCYRMINQKSDIVTVWTPRDTTKIKHPLIKQVFVSKNIYDKGIIKINHNGRTVKIYEKEKLLVDFVRNKKKYDPTLYDQVLNSYFNSQEKIDFDKLNQYADIYQNGKNIIDEIYDKFDILV